MDAYAKHAPWNALAASGTQRSGKSSLKLIRSCSYQLFWTGTVAGTFTVQVSNKETPDESTDTDWTDMNLASPINQPSGSAGNDFVQIVEPGALWIRLKHVLSSGAGNLSAFFVGKGY